MVPLTADVPALFSNPLTARLSAAFSVTENDVPLLTSTLDVVSV